MADNFGPQEFWETYLGREHGTKLQLCLGVIASVPRQELLDQIDKSLRDIEHVAAFGPLFHPSAFQDGTRWKNAESHARLLKALRELRAALPDVSDRKT